MKLTLSIVVAGAGLLMMGLPVAAHHSFAAEYDSTKKVELKGVVTKFEWTNPHAHFYLDVTDPNGKVANWNLELASPNMMQRNGWTRHSLKEGDQVVVVASPRQGRHQHRQRRHHPEIRRDQADLHGRPRRRT